MNRNFLSIVLFFICYSSAETADVFLDVCIDQKKDKGFNLKFFNKTEWGPVFKCAECPNCLYTWYVSLASQDLEKYECSSLGGILTHECDSSEIIYPLYETFTKNASIYSCNSGFDSDLTKKLKENHLQYKVVLYIDKLQRGHPRSKTQTSSMHFERDFLFEAKLVGECPKDLLKKINP